MQVGGDEMKKAPEIGSRGVKEMVVQPGDFAGFEGGGNVGAEVLSTPRLVLLVEQAARDAVGDALPEGMRTMGTLIQMKHLAATPLGVKVRAEAYLKKIDRRSIKNINKTQYIVFHGHEKLPAGFDGYHENGAFRPDACFYEPRNLKYIAARGGRVRFREKGRPWAETGMVSLPPKFPIPLPPYSMGCAPSLSYSRKWLPSLKR